MGGMIGDVHRSVGNDDRRYLGDGAWHPQPHPTTTDYNGTGYCSRLFGRSFRGRYAGGCCGWSNHWSRGRTGAESASMVDRTLSVWSPASVGRLSTVCWVQACSDRATAHPVKPRPKFAFTAAGSPPSPLIAAHGLGMTR